MVVIKNILVATEFSEPSNVALAYGRDLARTYDAQLHVLHVVEDLITRYAPEVAFTVPDLQRELEQAAARDLNEQITDDDRRTLRLTAVIDQGANVADTITRYAREHQVDLIITGTHGRGPVKHFLMGSVAERVVRTAPCPVLTVHSPEREFIAPDALVAATHA